MKNAISITKRLVSLQSYKDDKNYESEVVNFMFSYMEIEFPWLKVEKQFVSRKRWNIFAKDSEEIKILALAHLDTVQPSSSWKTNPLKLVEKNEKLYGLGASDCKGSISAFLCALDEIKDTKGLAILWYVDEEYDFLGMKKFCQSKLMRTINPKYVMSIDGSEGKLSRGCRGLIEIKLFLRGKIGHSAKNNGISVTKGFIVMMREIENWLLQYKSPFLGDTTLNIAGISAGLEQITTDDKSAFFVAGNRIPDYLEATLELRVASNNLRSKEFIKKLYEVGEKNGSRKTSDFDPY